MKRTQPTLGNLVPKRTKAARACEPCRRMKSRCEILDIYFQPAVPGTLRCHRCTVVGVKCSFESSNFIHSPEPTQIENSLDSPASESSGNAEITADNSPPVGRGMRPEDLVPTSTTPIWGSVNRVDWTAAPMLAIQELIRCPLTEYAGPIPSGERLEDILSPAEITSLFQMSVLFSLSVNTHC
jgi:hypothetical protein